MVSASNGRTPLRQGQISWGRRRLYPVTVTNASFAWTISLVALHTGCQREQRWLWSMHAGHGWGRTNVPMIGSVWEWLRDHIVGCVIGSKSPLNWRLVWEEKGARHLEWGVQYAKSQYVKSAGQRDMISISSCFFFFFSSQCTLPVHPLHRM